MPRNVNIDDLDFGDLVKRLNRSLDECEIPALKDIEQGMKRRIHNRGNATDGTPIGQYSLPYAKRRREAGRQVRRVDLEFEGDMRRDLTVGTSGKENVLGFKNKFENLKAASHEERYGKEIYTPSESEINRATKSYEKCVSELVAKAIDLL